MLKVIDEYEDSPSKRPMVEQFLKRAGTLRLASGSWLQRAESSKHKVSNERLREATSHGQHSEAKIGRLSGKHSSSNI